MSNLSRDRRIDEICTRFEQAWRAGQRPRIEDHLTEGAEREALLRELLAVELFHRQQLGEFPTMAEYEERFPNLDAATLDELFAEPETVEYPDCIRANPTEPPRIPDLPGYEDLVPIGRGGMGVVFRAWQITLKRYVALKMILPGPLVTDEAVQLFRREARNVARLKHNHIVPIFEVGDHQGQPYFTMGLVEGGSLDAHLAEFVADPRKSARLMALVARAVHHAHQHGLIHRDLKPSNVLVDAEDQPVVTDFGLAKRLEASIDQSRSNAVIGTPCYMAPEQARGRQARISTVTDVYGLGAILYELLTGHPPFRGDTPLETLMQVLNEEPIPPHQRRPGVPRDLEVICLKCIDKDPKRRYRSAEEVAEDLERYLKHEPIQGRPVGTGERVVRWIRRHPAPAALILVSFLASLAGVGVVVANSYNAVLAEKNTQLSEALSAEEAAKEVARASETRANRYLYVTRMTQAEQARKEGNTGRVLQLLRSVIPERPDQEDLRGWEWHQMWRAHQGEQSRLRGHTGPIAGVAFSPDDRWLASSSEDGTLRIWDLLTGKEKHCLRGHVGRVNGLAISDDGKMLASAGDDKLVRLWDPIAGVETGQLEGHEDRVTCVAICPTTGRIVSGSFDQTVRLWDAAGKEVRTYRQHPAPIFSVGISPDGSTIASTSQSVHIKSSTGPAKPGLLAWETNTGMAVSAVGMGDGFALAWSPSGDHVAVGGESLTKANDKNLTPYLRIIDSSGAKATTDLTGHTAGIIRLAFSREGKSLVSGSHDQTLRIWDVPSGRQVAAFHEDGPVFAVAANSTGSQFASGSEDGVVKLWNLRRAEPRALGAGRSGLAFSPDGKKLASVGAGIKIYDTNNGNLLESIPGGAETRVSWSRDRHLLVAQNEVWRLETMEKVAVLTTPKNGIYYVKKHGYVDVEFSPDGSYMVGAFVMGGKEAFQVWETATWRSLRAMPTDAWATCVSVSPDQRWIAGGTSLNKVNRTHLTEWLKIWDFDSGEEVRGLAGFLDCVWRVKFSPDGQYLAAAIGYQWGNKFPGEVRIWRVGTWELVWRLRGHQEIVYSLGFSPDSHRLVSVGGKSNAEVKVWDLTTGQEVWTLPTAWKGSCYDAAFSPDGRYLALVGTNNKLLLYDGTPMAETPAYQPLPADEE